MTTDIADMHTDKWNELKRDIDEWYSKRWDVETIERYGFLLQKKRRVVKPNIAQLDKDLQTLIEKGPQAIFREMLLAQRGVSEEKADSIMQDLDGGNAYFELMGRRCEAGLFNSDDIKKVEQTEWFQKKIALAKEKDNDPVRFSLEEKHPHISQKEQSMKEWCSKRWYGDNKEEGAFNKKQFDEDVKMLDQYRGRQELVRDILIRQGGFSEEQAERDMNYRDYTSRAIVELMRK